MGNIIRNRKILASKPGGGGGVSKTTADVTAMFTVGSVTAGDVIPSGSTLQDIVEDIFLSTFYPTYTAPSGVLSHSLASLVETGYTGDVVLTLTYNRGSINGKLVGGVWQPLTFQDYRGGVANNYTIDGDDLDLVNTVTVVAYVVTSGANTFTGSVDYDLGVQPIDSDGVNYQTPLAAGTINTTCTFSGVYPLFANTVAIGTLTKQALISMSSVYFQVDVVAETGGSKQTVDIPDAWSAITGIQFYNTSSSAWEWIAGTKVNSLLTFTVSSVTNTIQGNVVNYDRYTHNGDTTGARQLRFYTT